MIVGKGKGGGSGSLITADFALEQGKDIYAVPGRVTDSLSMGCNNLIRQGAGIINSVEDFVKILVIVIHVLTQLKKILTNYYLKKNERAWCMLV